MKGSPLREVLPSRAVDAEGSAGDSKGTEFQKLKLEICQSGQRLEPAISHESRWFHSTGGVAMVFFGKVDIPHSFCWEFRYYMQLRIRRLAKF